MGKVDTGVKVPKIEDSEAERGRILQSYGVGYEIIVFQILVPLLGLRLISEWYMRWVVRTLKWSVILRCTQGP